MTEVKMLTKGQYFVGFEITGHAGYAPAGNDIVCAAISTISQATIIGINEVIGAMASITEDEAYLRLEVNESLCEIQVLLKTMYLVLSDVAKQYEKHIKLCTKEINNDIIESNNR